MHFTLSFRILPASKESKEEHWVKAALSGCDFEDIF